MTDDTAFSNAHHIRRARRDDQDELRELWWDFMQDQADLDRRLSPAADARQRWSNDYEGWLQDERHRIWVVEKKGTLIAFLTAQLYAPPPVYREALEVYINELFVVSSARRQGIGRELFERAETWARQSEAQRLRLVSLSANAHSRSFWRSVGAEPFTSTFILETGVENEPSAENRKPNEHRLGFT